MASPTEAGPYSKLTLTWEWGLSAAGCQDPAGSVPGGGVFCCHQALVGGAYSMQLGREGGGGVGGEGVVQVTTVMRTCPVAFVESGNALSPFLTIPKLRRTWTMSSRGSCGIPRSSSTSCNDRQTDRQTDTAASSLGGCCIEWAVGTPVPPPHQWPHTHHRHNAYTNTSVKNDLTVLTWRSARMSHSISFPFGYFILGTHKDREEATHTPTTTT